MEKSSEIYPCNPLRTCCEPGRFALRNFRRAFSLIEMMVVMALLSVIVIGLMAMFGQVQKAFRGSMTQTDVLESGRAAADMLSRDLAGVIPSYQSQVTNFYAQIPATPNPAITQTLPGAGGNRINTLEKLFFLTRENQNWIGYGYLVDDNGGTGVGTLYRYLATTNISINPNELFKNFKLGSAGLHRVMDGVVQFRIRAYTNGIFLTGDLPLPNNSGHIKSDIKTSGIVAGEVGLYVFKSNAVPDCVEFELGILEKRTYERYRAMTNVQSAAASFLQNQAGRVHLFRQRVPVRAVDVTAYQ